MKGTGPLNYNEARKVSECLMKTRLLIILKINLTPTVFCVIIKNIEVKSNLVILMHSASPPVLMYFHWES